MWPSFKRDLTCGCISLRDLARIDANTGPCTYPQMSASLHRSWNIQSPSPRSMLTCHHLPRTVLLSQFLKTKHGSPVPRLQYSSAALRFGPTLTLTHAIIIVSASNFVAKTTLLSTTSRISQVKDPALQRLTSLCGQTSARWQRPPSLCRTWIEHKALMRRMRARMKLLIERWDV